MDQGAMVLEEGAEISPDPHSEGKQEREEAHQDHAPVLQYLTMTEDEQNFIIHFFYSAETKGVAFWLFETLARVKQ